jgi:GNAT superfamily N-acetyltransferase
MSKPAGITPATEAEREWVASLLARSEPWITLGATAEDCRSSCHDPEYRLYIAHRDGRPVGAISLQRRGVASSPYVKSIVVDEGDRSQGVGSALLGFAEDYVIEGAAEILLAQAPEVTSWARDVPPG